MAAVGNLHPLAARARAQARRQPARAGRGDGDQERARRLHAAQRRRVDLGGSLGRHSRVVAGRSRGAVRAGQRQGLPASDVLPDARRSEAYLDDAIALRLPAAPWRQRPRARAAARRMGRQGSGARGRHRARPTSGSISSARRACGSPTPARSRRAMRRPRRTEDELAFLRDGREFRNLLLVEQPNGNYADTMARQFLFDHWHLLLLARARPRRATSASPRSPPRPSRKSRYHVERSADWVIRLGDGTDESHARMQAAIDRCGCTPARCSPSMRPSARWSRLASPPMRDPCKCRGIDGDRRGARRGDARGAGRRLDAGRARARRQAGRAHRASRSPARRDAVPAACLPGAHW